jgi:Family of unknown function (DUF5412)
MKKTLNTILGCFGFLILFVGIFVGMLFMVFSPDEMCGNHLVQQSLSPNKNLKVIIFSVDCGATTGFSTQISVVNSDYILEKNEKGNVFIADDDHGKSKTNGEIIDLNVKWVDNDNIIIEYDKNARVFKDKSSKKGVNITYKLK